MVINGRDVKFRRSVLANCEIADASPDGDVNRLIMEQLQGGSYAASQRAAVVIITALSKGYETAQQAADPAYKPNPITEREAMSLRENEFDDLFAEAMQEFISGGRRTVEAEEPKTEKKTGKDQAGGKSS